jgi:hypothetical protein
MAMVDVTNQEYQKQLFFQGRHDLKITLVFALLILLTACTSTLSDRRLPSKTADAQMLWECPRTT